MITKKDIDQILEIVEIALDSNIRVVPRITEDGKVVAQLEGVDSYLHGVRWQLEEIRKQSKR